MSRRNNSSSGTGNINGRSRPSGATASNNAASTASALLSSHPAEYNPEHIAFLQRSLDRNDADIAAVVELNRTLHTLRELIVVHCSELTLLDLGEGILRLAPDDGTGNSEQIVRVITRNNKSGENGVNTTENQNNETTPKSKLSFSPKVTTSSTKKAAAGTAATTTPSPQKGLLVKGMGTTPTATAKREPTTPEREISDINVTSSCKTPDDNKSTAPPLYYEPYYFESHYQEELCIDFCLRLKLRRKLLSRIVRRLLRIATAMDGTDVSPPPISLSKFGDIRLNIDDKLVAELMEQITRQQQTMEKITRRKEKEYDNSLHTEEASCPSIVRSSNSKSKDNRENTASPSKVLSSELLQGTDQTRTTTQLSKQDSETKGEDGPLTKGNDDKSPRQSPIKKRQYDDVSTKNPDERRSESGSNCEDESVNNREHKQSNLEQISVDAIDEFYRKRRKVLREDDYDSWKDYKDIYEKEIDPKSGTVFCYTIQKLEGRKNDAVKQSTAPLTSNTVINDGKNKESDPEWNRYKESLVARIPIQPTYAELGMEYTLFYGKERRKRALEKLSQSKENDEFEDMETNSKFSNKSYNSENDEDSVMGTKSDNVENQDSGTKTVVHSNHETIDDTNPTMTDKRISIEKENGFSEDANSDDVLTDEDRRIIEGDQESKIHDETRVRNGNNLEKQYVGESEVTRASGEEDDTEEFVKIGCTSEPCTDTDNTVGVITKSLNNKSSIEINVDNDKTTTNSPREGFDDDNSELVSRRSNNIKSNESICDIPCDMPEYSEKNNSATTEDNVDNNTQPNTRKSENTFREKEQVEDRNNAENHSESKPDDYEQINEGLFTENSWQSGDDKDSRIRTEHESMSPSDKSPKKSDQKNEPCSSKIQSETFEHFDGDMDYVKATEYDESQKDNNSRNEGGLEKSDTHKKNSDIFSNGKTRDNSQPFDGGGDDNSRKDKEERNSDIGTSDKNKEDPENLEKESYNKPTHGDRQDQNSDQLQDDKGKDNMTGLPKKIRPISLVPIPSFYEQDMKRIKLIHSDLVNASMQMYARKKLEDCTKSYNAALQTSNEIYDRLHKLQSRLSNLTVELRHQQSQRLEYSSKVNVERNRWNKRRFQFEQNRNNLLLPSRRGAYSQGTPFIQHYASRHDHTGISHQVGQCLADIVDVVHNVATGRLRLERFSERFVPPPDPFGTDPNTGESLVLIKQRMEKELRHEIDQMSLKLKASEESRSHAWRKMLKTKAEYGILHDVSITGPPRYVKVDTNNPTVSIPLPELRKSTTQNLVDGNHQPPAASSRSFTPAARRVVNTPRPHSSTPTKNPLSSQSLPGSVAESKYSAARVKERKASDGTVKPVEQPKLKDGLFLRPAGRTRKGMEWDAVRGIWIPAPGLNSSVDEDD